MAAAYDEEIAYLDAQLRRLRAGLEGCAVAERGLAASGIVMLDALLKLRQVCCDPRLVKLESVRKTKRSAKLEQLRELVGPLV